MVLCLSVLLLTPWWMETGPETSVGAPPPLGRLPGRAPDSPSIPAGEGTPPPIAVHSLRLTDLERTASGPAPVRLVIRAIGVDARIVPVGVQREGAMRVPENVATLGWYRFGPSPGASGSAVLVGHVDSRVQGAGVFFRLRELQTRDVVRVQVSDGEWRPFEVVWRTLVPKEGLPRRVFAREGSPVLSLITCGGGFDAAEGHYTHNVVVGAVPRG